MNHSANDGTPTMEDSMALEQRIESLRKRHTEIEARIHGEESRPAPDVALVHRMKREKLILKDEIERLCHGQKQAA
jgi:hypothetical protein